MLLGQELVVKKRAGWVSTLLPALLIEERGIKGGSLEKTGECG